MATLNLRDVPDELYRLLRVEAVTAGMGIREYCVAILEARKKIAWVSDGIEAQGDGVTPSLPREGKAQEPVIYGLDNPSDAMPVKSYPLQDSKPDMALLQDICDGKFPEVPKEHFEAYDALMAGQEQLSGVLPAPLCSVCEQPLRESKGKWACPDQSCAMYGKVQKGKK